MEKSAMSLTDGSPDLVHPKLPAWTTVRHSYSSYFRHFSDVLRASWLWLIAVAALTSVAAWQQWSWMATAIANHAYPQMPKPAEMILLSGLSTALALFAGVSIAVAWHRLLILDERPGPSGSNVTTKDLWRYVLVGLALCLIVSWPALALTFPALIALPPVGHGSPSATFILTIMLGSLFQVAGGVVVLRCLMLLPARAIGNTGLTFRQAWNRTRGNIWRLFWGVWLTIAPPLLIAQIAFLALYGLPAPGVTFGEDVVARIAIFTTVVSVYNLLILPIGIGFLSHAYQHFFPAPIRHAA
jgi:hypothetical protein